MHDRQFFLLMDHLETILLTLSLRLVLTRNYAIQMTDAPRNIVGVKYHIM